MNYILTKRNSGINMCTHLVEDLGDFKTLCGRNKSSLTKMEQWFTATSLVQGDFEAFEWCRMCSDHPHFQLLLLAYTDL